MCYSFVFMGICVWQNMNLVVVEDSYLNVKYRSSYGWLTGDEEEGQAQPESNGQAAIKSKKYDGGGGDPPGQGPPPDQF